MKILFDHQIFSTQVYGGISRYFSEVIRHLGMDDAAQAEISASFSNNAYLGGNPAFRGRTFLKGARFKGKNRALYLMNQFASSQSLKAGGFDVFHPTFFDPYFLPLLRGKPFVLTIYDMIHELFPEHFPSGDTTSARKRLLAGEASRIIAISETTKRDIMRFYKIPESKIRVISLCDSFERSSLGEQDAPPFPRYFLFVGKRQAYKNFLAMVSALAPLFQEDRALKLVCTGGDPISAEETLALESLGGPERWVRVEVSDARLKTLYRGAIALVFPSLYEGFGIPILEAFHCGCPALLSRASCFPEIAGDAALYFNPGDPEDFEAKLRLIATSAETRAKLIELGHRRVRDFSWKRCAEETLQVYRAALG